MSRGDPRTHRSFSRHPPQCAPPHRNGSRIRRLLLGSQLHRWRCRVEGQTKEEKKRSLLNRPLQWACGAFGALSPVLVTSCVVLDQPSLVALFASTSTDGTRLRRQVALPRLVVEVIKTFVGSLPILSLFLRSTSLHPFPRLLQSLSTCLVFLVSTSRNLQTYAVS